MTAAEPKPPCQEAARELYMFLDGVLDDNKRAAIAHHLDQCPPCGDAYGFEEELRALIARRCQDSVPAGLRARIAQAIEACDDTDTDV